MPNISEIRTGIDGSRTIEWDDGAVKVLQPVYMDSTGVLDSQLDSLRSAQTYAAPRPSGYDDTVVLQQFFDDMSSDALAKKEYRRDVSLYQKGTYLVTGLWHPTNLGINGSGGALQKVGNVTGSMFTSPTSSIIRAKWVKKNGSWYGSSNNMRLSNIILDACNTEYLAIMEYYNVRNLELDNVTTIASQWSLNWSTRIGGQGIKISNCNILNGERVWQDALHIQFGRDIVVTNVRAEGGDDCIAVGDDQITSPNPYYDDQGLQNVIVDGARVQGIRGNGVKVYTPMTKPFPDAPYNYVKSGRVSGVKISAVGKAGLLRNGAVSLYNHALADNRVPSDLADCEITVEIEAGTDGTSVYSAVPGIIIGDPTVSKASAAVVSMPSHNLQLGDVVSFINIAPSGMQNLIGFYQARAVTQNTFELSDTAFRNTVALNSSQFATWTTGTLIKCSSGTGYKVGDDLILSGGSPLEPAIFKVTQVGLNGEVQAVKYVAHGKYSTLPPTPNTPTTNGLGTGCTLHLELSHSGINAFGMTAVGASDSVVKGKILVNDSTGTATRFRAGYIADSQQITNAVDYPSVPEGGGTLVYNESSTQKSKNNKVIGHYVCSPAMTSSVAPVMLSNSENTYVSGLFEGIPTNGSGVVFYFSGNILNPRTIANITSADPAVFTTFAFPWKNNDYVLIQNNTLSSGSLDGVYQILFAADNSTITLKTLDGQAVKLATGVTFVNGQGGTITLANNTCVVNNLTCVKASGAVSTTSIGAASSSPPRGTALIVKDSDFSKTDSGIGSTIGLLPILSIQDTKGVTLFEKTYRQPTVIHDMTTTGKIVVIVPDAAVTISPPVNSRKGMTLEVIISQAFTPQTITWASNFKKVADGTGVSFGTGVTKFIYNGTDWIQMTGQLTYVS